MANRYNDRAVGLSDAKIKGLRLPTTGQIEIADKVVPGLRVRVGAGGAKTFVLRKHVAGKYRNITLGRYSERLTLAAARKKARQLLSDFEFRADPAASIPKIIRRSDQGYTIQRLLPDYLKSKAHLRNLREVERVFKRHILPEFGDRAADRITRSEITRFIDRLAPGAPVMARNILAHFSSFYTWALPRLDHIPCNPCRDAGRPRAPKPRERVLSEKEIVALWQVLGEETGPFGPAIKLLLLTGQRRAEVFEADCEEFELKKGLWTIPASRAKNDKTHLVPLAPLSISLVKELIERDLEEFEEDSPKLLPARGNPKSGPSGFSKAMRRIRAKLEDKLGDPVPHWVLHDLRRTMATGLQRLGVRLEVTEAVLNHISGSRAGIVGIYQRHDYFEEKKAALRAWEREILRLAAGGRSRGTRRRTGEMAATVKKVVVERPSLDGITEQADGAERLSQGREPGSVGLLSGTVRAGPVAGRPWRRM